MATYDREAEAARFSGEAQTALYLAAALEVSGWKLGLVNATRNVRAHPTTAQVGAVSVGGLVAAEMIDVMGIIAASSLALAGVRGFLAVFATCTLTP